MIPIILRILKPCLGPVCEIKEKKKLEMTLKFIWCNSFLLYTFRCRNQRKKEDFCVMEMGGPCSKTQENVNGVSCLFYLPRRIRLCKQQLEALARLLLSANSNIPRKSQKSDSYILIKPSVNSRRKGLKKAKKCLNFDFLLVWLTHCVGCLKITEKVSFNIASEFTFWVDMN